MSRFNPIYVGVSFSTYAVGSTAITVDTGSELAENLIIYTILGNVVREVNPMTHHIDISDLSSGLYILRLTFDRKVVVKKLIKI